MTLTCAAPSGTVLHMPRQGYRAVSLEDPARTNLSEFRRRAAAVLGRDLTLSDALGVAVVLAHQMPETSWDIAHAVFVEGRNQVRANR
jgi:hypothetical protein